MTESVEELSAVVEELRAQVALLREETGVNRAVAQFQMRPNIIAGKDCTIAPTVAISAPDETRRVILGDYVKLYRGVEIVGPVSIGKLSFINRDGYVRPDTIIGDRVSIGPFVRLVTDNHDLGPSTQRSGRFHTVPITIEDGVWIGAGVTVVGGVTVGAGSVIAAGAVVVHDVPPNSLVAGVPARVVRLLE